MKKLLISLLFLTMAPLPSFCAKGIEGMMIVLDITADSDADAAYVRRGLTEEINRLGDIQVATDRTKAFLALEVIGNRVETLKGESMGYWISATLVLLAPGGFTPACKKVLDDLGVQTMVYVDNVTAQNSFDRVGKIFRDIVNMLDDRNFDKWRRVAAAMDQSSQK